MDRIIIESRGCIVKEEKLATIDSNIIKGTFVLETVNPFYGYYSADPEEKKSIPKTIFYILDQFYYNDDIARAVNVIKKYIGFDLDVVRAEINIHNTNYSAIRVYDIKDYDHVLSLQKAFASEGIKFKSKTTNIEGSFEMKIWKVFLLENTQPGIYMNRSKSKMSYFEINKHLSWTHFKAITKKVKSNWTGKSFDAALGMIYRKHGLEEVVRIFSNAIDENMTVELKSLYDKFIESEN